MAERTIQDLWQMQGLPLNIKVRMTQQRIRDWVHAYGEDGVYVSFSGGKDSTVLLHLVRELYPSVRGVFVDTGLEYPEIRSFVRTFDNIEWLKPKMTFKQVIQKYGYPFISKEVAECVYGARKYLTRVMEEASLEQTDRQTDRQSQNIGIDLISYADSMSLQQPSRGGGGQQVPQGQRNRRIQYRFEWEKLTATGRYMGSRPQMQNWGGGGPARDFANLTGIRTTEGGVDSRLYKGYRQFSDSASDGNTSSDGKSNDGDYP